MAATRTCQPITRIVVETVTGACCGERRAPAERQNCGLAAYNNVHDGGREKQEREHDGEVEEQLLHAAPRPKNSAFTAAANAAKAGAFALQHDCRNQRNRHHDLNKIYVKSHYPNPPLAWPKYNTAPRKILHAEAHFSNDNLTAKFEHAGIIID